MAFRDVREFTDALRRTGDLVVVDREVDWELEVGAIGRRACERDGPAILFRNIKDYPGWAILENPLASWRRLAIALGLPPAIPLRELYQEYERRLDNPPQKSILVDTGPCKENIILGEEVDLFRLPSPLIHEGDGGRYLGTWDLVVSQDPETGWTNWGTYRFLVHNERTLGGYPRPTSHLGRLLREKFAPQGKAMPIAIAIGVDPLSNLVAATTFPLGAEEAELAGALRGEPVELVRCETSDLLVPAQAEIVIEGEVLPDRIVSEGPYGEYPGYRSGTMGIGIAVRVRAITYRHNTILTVDCTGYKDTTSVVTAIGAAINIKRRLLRHGIPVTDVFVPPEGCVHLAIVGVRGGGGDVTERVLELLIVRRADISKILVVDEDVDVFDLGQVLHAFATKCHPGRGIFVAHYEGRANTITPYYDEEERQKLRGATAAFDCTWPPQWRQEEVPMRAFFDQSYPQELRDRVVAHWREYGFQE